MRRKHPVATSGHDRFLGAEQHHRPGSPRLPPPDYHRGDAEEIPPLTNPRHARHDLGELNRETLRTWTERTACLGPAKAGFPQGAPRIASYPIGPSIGAAGPRTASTTG